jgi:general stress protein CsbA
VLKQKLALCTTFDPSSLPYNQDFLRWLKEQHSLDRKLVLCTASDQSIATAISQHLGIFAEVLASDGITNLSGTHKADVLEKRWGRAGFDYAGNSNADLAVWQFAHRAVVVNAAPELVKQVGTYCEVEKEFPSQSGGFTALFRALRMKQWLKNILLFIPLFAAHRFDNLETWWLLAMSFLAFSLCASAVYVANDLLDLESDRQHPRKNARPFASGLIPAWVGVILAPFLLLASLTLAWQVGGAFLPWLIFYFAVTCAYSLGLKSLVIVDCLT